MRGKKISRQRGTVQLNQSAIQFLLLVYALKKFAKHKDFVNLMLVLMAFLAILPLASANTFSGEGKEKNNNSDLLPFSPVDAVIKNNSFSFFNNTCPIGSFRQEVALQFVRKEEYKPVSHGEKLITSDKKLISQQDKKKNSQLFDVQKQSLEKEIVKNKYLPQKVAHYVKKIPICEEYKKNIKTSPSSPLDLSPRELEKKIRAELRSLLLETLYQPLLDNSVIFPIDIDLKQTAPAYTTVIPENKITFSLKTIEQIVIYPNYLRTLLANELYHISIAENNRRFDGINLYDDTELFSPYRGKVEMTDYMFKTKSSLTSLFSYINFNNYNDDKKTLIRDFMVNIVSYNLNLCFELKKIAVKRNLMTSAVMSFINPYGQLPSARQLYELGSDIASVLILLNKKDKSHFDDWIKYHSDFYNQAKSNKFQSLTIK